MDAAITTTNLTKHFGAVEALRGLSLEIPKGSVYGYLGRNGSGKTTTIKLLLGLLDPTRGSSTVLGYDPQVDPVPARRRVGYVAEGQRMYGWMKVREIIRFTGGFYDTWNQDLAESYLKRFDLMPDARVKTLSKGQNARLALLLALSSQPELLILDDPTMGLDPISRQEFLADIVRAIHEEGRTVFFSTHILQELEQVADWVGILDHGELLASGPVDDLKATVKRYEMTFEGLAPREVHVDGLLRIKADGRDLLVTAEGDPEQIMRHLHASYSPMSMESYDLSLDEIFAEVVLGHGEGAAPYMPAILDAAPPGPDDAADATEVVEAEDPEVNP
jgi:ABC-2 type transport system ATP-binding protein